MSIKFINWAFQIEGLNPTQKVLLIALADNANDDGYCYPSIATLCLKTGLTSKNSIRNNLKILTEKGYLTITERLRPNGSKTSNSYILGGGAKFEGGVVQNLREGGSFNEGGVGRLKGGAIEPPLEPPLKLKNIQKEIKGKSNAKRKTSINTKFGESCEMPTEYGEYARSKGREEPDIKLQWEKFCNYFIGEGKGKIDWLATWRNWILNDFDRKRSGSSGTGRFKNRSGGGSTLAAGKKLLAKYGDQ